MLVFLTFLFTFGFYASMQNRCLLQNRKYASKDTRCQNVFVAKRCFRCRPPSGSTNCIFFFYAQTLLDGSGSRETFFYLGRRKKNTRQDAWIQNASGQRPFSKSGRSQLALLFLFLRCPIGIHRGSRAVEGKVGPLPPTYHPPHAALVLLPLAGHFGASWWKQQRSEEKKRHRQRDRGNTGDPYKDPGSPDTFANNL